MKAYVVNEYGANAKFVAVEVAIPEPQKGQVLIEVKATSLNPIDNKILRNNMGFNPELPGILHGDVAGIVVGLGEGVNNFQIGDEVFGCIGGVKGYSGALAEYVVADVRLLAPKPNRLSFAEAAALPLVSITAWLALLKRAQITYKDFILIHGGCGGVGHMAVQIAKQMKAKVATTVSSPEKADIARKLGADEVINYKEESVEDYVKRLTDGKGFDVIFDTVGGKNLDASFAAAAIGGRVSAIAARSTHDLSPLHAKGLSFNVIFMLIPFIHGGDLAHYGDILLQIATWVDEDKVLPLVDKRRFKFSEANQAHEYFESGKYEGKIVLEI